MEQETSNANSLVDEEGMWADAMRTANHTSSDSLVKEGSLGGAKLQSELNLLGGKKEADGQRENVTSSASVSPNPSGHNLPADMAENRKVDMPENENGRAENVMCVSPPEQDVAATVWDYLLLRGKQPAWKKEQEEARLNLESTLSHLAIGDSDHTAPVFQPDLFPHRLPGLKPKPLWIRVVSAMVAGVFFGIMFVKGGVMAPAVIHSQFHFTHWTMFKILLSGALCAEIAFCIIYLTGGYERGLCITARFHMHQGHRGLYAAVSGAVLLGIGMALSGGCPGSYAASIGAGLAWRSSVAVIAGLFTGALLFSIAEPHIQSFLTALAPCGEVNFRYSTVDRLLNAMFPLLGAMMMLGCLGGLILLELLVPWKSDLTARQLASIEANPDMFWRWLVWPPWVTGIMMLPVQYILMTTSMKTSGCSTAYCVAFAQLLRPFPFLRDWQHLKFFKNLLVQSSTPSEAWLALWQVFYMSGVFFAGTVAAIIVDPARPSYCHFEAFPPIVSFVGAACCMFGSRLGVGCASHNALSGMPMMYTLSIVSVPGFFLGGVPTVYIMQALGFQIEKYLT